jgi:putative membrane protein
MMWEWHSGWAWWWMGVAMLVFWALVAWVVVTLVRQSDRGSPETPGAREILDARYARGEIDDDEYRRRSELIRS